MVGAIGKHGKGRNLDGMRVAQEKSYRCYFCIVFMNCNKLTLITWRKHCPVEEKVTSIPIDQIVIVDIILIDAGDKIPCDGLF